MVMVAGFDGGGKLEWYHEIEREGEKGYGRGMSLHHLNLHVTVLSVSFSLPFKFIPNGPGLYFW